MTTLSAEEAYSTGRALYARFDFDGAARRLKRAADAPGVSPRCARTRCSAWRPPSDSSGTCPRPADDRRRSRRDDEGHRPEGARGALPRRTRAGGKQAEGRPGARTRSSRRTTPSRSTSSRSAVSSRGSSRGAEFVKRVPWPPPSRALSRSSRPRGRRSAGSGEPGQGTATVAPARREAGHARPPRDARRGRLARQQPPPLGGLPHRDGRSSSTGHGGPVRRAEVSRGQVLKFAFSETPLSVYAEQFTIEVPASSGARAPAGAHGIRRVPGLQRHASAWRRPP